jgi:hypothetical protein
VWQSDATQGVSAKSSCIGRARQVICVRRSTVAGVQRDELLHEIRKPVVRFYVVPNPGDTLTPLPLTISGATWTYGGVSPGPSGRWFRTINDFSKRDEYSWRLETSDDGKSWRTANGGRSQRVLPSKR